MRSIQLSFVVGSCLAVLLAACTFPHAPTPPSHTQLQQPVHPNLPPSTPPPSQPVTEIRAVWVSDTTKLDWNIATRDLQIAGFNTMYVNLASAGAALYPGSKVLPSTIDGLADPVARGIALAHRRGLAVYAKQIVMFSFDSPPDYQHQLLKSDRVMRGANLKPILQGGDYWVCPCDPANHKVAAAVLAEMLTKYPVDGLQFDYIRFNENPSCYGVHCREQFEKFIGSTVHHWPTDVITGSLTTRFVEWRQAVITDWVRELSTLARQTRPGIKISAAVFPVLERSKDEKGQNWKLWLDLGYLDYVCPMNYTADLNEFTQRSQEVLGDVPRNRVVMGIASWKMAHLDDLNRHIDVTRKLGTAGFSLFSYDDAFERSFLPNLTTR